MLFRDPRLARRLLAGRTAASWAKIKKCPREFLVMLRPFLFPRRTLFRAWRPYSGGDALAASAPTSAPAACRATGSSGAPRRVRRGRRGWQPQTNVIGRARRCIGRGGDKSVSRINSVQVNKAPVTLSWADRANDRGNCGKASAPNPSLRARYLPSSFWASSARAAASRHSSSTALMLALGVLPEAAPGPEPVHGAGKEDTEISEFRGNAKPALVEDTRKW